ncbi:hypothetical protein ACFZAR_43805 [Streptomyces sp. NPDC008222]|uniref:hypothetical protein n=1 Tax=Streptomyces sp. NPDC008222 TaxID=3364820 RepID=UPI0036E5C81E
MNLTKSFKRAAAAVGLGVLSAGLLVGGAGSASAASTTPYRLTLCSYGNYYSYAQLPQQGGQTTFSVAPGKCTTIGLYSSTTYAAVLGKWGGNQYSFYIATVPVYPSRGSLIETFGTVTNPYVYYSN